MRLARKNRHYELVTKVSHKSVWQTCPTRTSYRFRCFLHSLLSMVMEFDAACIPSLWCAWVFVASSKFFPCTFFPFCIYIGCSLKILELLKKLPTNYCILRSTRCLDKPAAFQVGRGAKKTSKKVPVPSLNWGQLSSTNCYPQVIGKKGTLGRCQIRVGCQVVCPDSSKKIGSMSCNWQNRST